MAGASLHTGGSIPHRLHWKRMVLVYLYVLYLVFKFNDITKSVLSITEGGKRDRSIIGWILFSSSLKKWSKLGGSSCSVCLCKSNLFPNMVFISSVLKCPTPGLHPTWIYIVIWCHSVWMQKPLRHTNCALCLVNNINNEIIWKVVIQNILACRRCFYHSVCCEYSHENLLWQLKLVPFSDSANIKRWMVKFFEHCTGDIDIRNFVSDFGLNI
jgi:hypothetical protein